jgi:hypothetical protein
VLSEQTVVERWREVFAGGPVTGETIQLAQALIDQLPPESPVRLRLGREINELRKLHEANSDARA